MTAFNPHEYLNSFNNFESQLHKLRPEDFYLNRVEKFLELAGNPAEDLKIIHVAGTKGKGSTSIMMASMLQEAGFKVGLYTSPHLFKVNERIRILNADNLRSKDNFKGSISDDDLGQVLNFLRPYAAAVKNAGNILTYFEVLTVAALTYFAKSQVDIVILETGLGGRLDATNAVDSMIAVLTPISLDHTRILGTTISQIAFEKAGIIKNSHQKVVIAPQEKEAMDVILNRCREFGVEFLVVKPEQYENLRLSLKGKHQQVNAMVALEVMNSLRKNGFTINDEAIKGLNQTCWPGRFQLLRNSPDLIVDCAHNGASAQALAETLKEEYPNRRAILVLGISEDKDIAAICNALKDRVDRVLLTKANHPRAHQFNQVEGKKYWKDTPFEIMDQLPKALEKALQIAKAQDVIIVTGSVFVVAELKGILSNNLFAQESKENVSI